VDVQLGARRALVLCATEGIGRECALALARECAEVTIVARNPKGLESTRSAIAGESGTDICTIAADVATQSGIATILNDLTSPPDIVVLVPPRHGPPPAVPSGDDVEDQFLRELRRPLSLVEGLLPHMRSQGWGRVVHLTGAAVKRPAGKLLPMTALRLALIAYLRGMSQQEAKYGITMNTIMIGYVGTPGLKRNWVAQAGEANVTYAELLARKLSESSIDRLGTPAEIAALVVHLASEHSGYITGEAISCDGGRGGFV
jgi:3-oxoacyl-[acyl-carrier protein] reductase